jgi:hypothetical protein
MENTQVSENQVWRAFYVIGEKEEGSMWCTMVREESVGGVGDDASCL